MRRISSLAMTVKRRNHLWRLHPPPPSKEASSSINQSKTTKVSNSKFNFNLNDNVYIRPKSTKEFGISGRIVDITSSVSSGSTTTSAKDGNGIKKRRLEDIRVSIQQSQNGNIKVGVRPSRLFPIYESKETLIIITPDTTNYRQLATSHLRVSDKVLEIGCSTGECTALVLRRLMLLYNNNNLKQEQKNDVQNGSICAFDIGSDMVEQASSRVHSEFNALQQHSHQAADLQMPTYTDMVQFYKIDALLDPKRAYTLATTNTINSNPSKAAPDVILIDIGGNRELKGVVQMIEWVQSAFCQNDDNSVRVIVVKSESLAEELTKSPKEEDEKKIEADSSTVQQQLVMDNGIINQGQEWFTTLLSSFSTNTTASTATNHHQRCAPTYNHPLKAPLVLSPKDDTAICRFHNYDIDGCKNGTRCPYDHQYCHWCREIGHTALNCHHFK